MMLWQITTMVGLFVFPLSLLSAGVLALKMYKQPTWLLILVAVAGLFVLARFSAALFLRLNLHRLVFLQGAGNQ